MRKSVAIQSALCSAGSQSVLHGGQKCCAACGAACAAMHGQLAGMAGIFRFDSAHGKGKKSLTSQLQYFRLESLEKNMPASNRSSSPAPPARRSAPSTAPSPTRRRMSWAPSSSRKCWRAPASSAAEVDEVILGQVLTAGAGPEPGPPGVDQGRPAEGDDRLGPQPGLRLGPARHRARHAADRHRRRQDHRRRRPGIDVAVAALRSICAPASRWATSR